jgi:ElaB/YqjD/DUF883 family membrane-anchored ribosome-binding protein
MALQIQAMTLIPIPGFNQYFGIDLNSLNKVKMTLKSLAQDFLSLDLVSPASQLPADDNSAHDDLDIIIPLDLQEMPESLELSEPVDVEIVVEEIPGAPPGTHDPEPIVVSEEPMHVKEKEDENDAKKSSKKGKWDWESKGAEGFVVWVKDMLLGVPKHSGQEESGLERAISYLEKLDAEVSKAMRLDLDGELDADKVEEIRSKIDEGLERLHDRLKKVRDTKKPHRKKKSDTEYELVKEAQKAAGISGIVVTVPLLISLVARVIINGTVSAGHDSRDLFQRQVKKFKLDVREQAEVMQLLEDMNFPIRGDRGFFPDEDLEVSDSNNMDWAANFSG